MTKIHWHQVPACEPRCVRGAGCPALLRSVHGPKSFLNLNLLFPKMDLGGLSFQLSTQ